MPEPPGPPGLIRSEPIRWDWVLDRTRMRAIPYVWPVVLSFQSRGTRTVAQSYVMVLAPRPTSDLGMSEQSRQSVPPPVGAAVPSAPGPASPEPSGANVGTVQPATARTTANRSTATRRRRRGTITAFRWLSLLDRGYPVGPTRPLSGRSVPWPD